MTVHRCPVFFLVEIPLATSCLGVNATSCIAANRCIVHLPPGVATPVYRSNVPNLINGAERLSNKNAGFAGFGSSFAIIMSSLL